MHMYMYSASVHNYTVAVQCGLKPAEVHVHVVYMYICVVTVCLLWWYSMLLRKVCEVFRYSFGNTPHST